MVRLALVPATARTAIAVSRDSKLRRTPTFIAGHEAAFGKLTLADLKTLVAEDRKYKL